MKMSTETGSGSGYFSFIARILFFCSVYLHKVRGKHKKESKPGRQNDREREGGQEVARRMDFGSGVPWREVQSVAAAISFDSPPPPLSFTHFASFHTGIHEKFMTVSLSLSRSPIPSPSPHTLLDQSIHLETDSQRGCNREETCG